MALVDASTRELQYDESTKKKCKTALKDIEQTVKTAVDGKTFSDSCKKFLKQEVDLECFLVLP
jgi:DNA polymerase III sliding clamp (beta) subunit (PCNA family)